MLLLIMQHLGPGEGQIVQSSSKRFGSEDRLNSERLDE
jgi:hypothetical protein